MPQTIADRPKIDFDTYWTDFGNRLKQARIAAGFASARQFAAHFYLDYCTISRIERAEGTPNASLYVWLVAWLEGQGR